MKVALALVGIDPLEGNPVAIFLFQPIHDGRDLRSRYSTVGINKNQGGLTCCYQ
jgi:hypothetical protein